MKKLPPAGQLIGIEFAGAWTFLLPKYVGPRKPATTTEADLAAMAAEGDIWPSDLPGHGANRGREGRARGA